MTSRLPPLPYPFDRPWPLAPAVELACVLEASAAKIGNVHPQANFADMGFSHFVASAIAIRPIFEQATEQSLGQLVLQSVVATRAVVPCNTNLGTLLLFAPLAKAHGLIAAPGGSLPQRLAQALNDVGPEDSQAVYAAIRAAQPGGLGRVSQGDVAGPAPDDLRTAMAQAASRDAVARQYVNDFDDVCHRLLPWLQSDLRHCGDPLEAICRLQLRCLAHEVDGLIVRKAGRDVADEVQRQAGDLLEASLASDQAVATRPQVQQLDAFLRGDGHRRNPGTTADLIAATLLAMLLEPN